jgi:hypothetical protein
MGSRPDCSCCPCSAVQRARQGLLTSPSISCLALVARSLSRDVSKTQDDRKAHPQQNFICAAALRVVKWKCDNSKGTERVYGRQDVFFTSNGPINTIQPVTFAIRPRPALPQPPQQQLQRLLPHTTCARTLQRHVTQAKWRRSCMRMALDRHRRSLAPVRTLGGNGATERGWAPCRLVSTRSTD